MQRTELMTWLQQELAVDMFKDYAPNGLQLQGKSDIGHITCAVTASLAAIEAAIENGSDLLLVHHGWFWKSEPTVITDWKFKRIQTAMQAGLNIAGYHLPLDAHPVVGNNAQLGKVLGLEMLSQFGYQNLLAEGVLPEVQPLQELTQKITHVDAYITGEISESQYHLANETGVAFISAGHHATEKFGVQALAKYIETNHGIGFQFFDEQNPA